MVRRTLIGLCVLLFALSVVIGERVVAIKQSLPQIAGEISATAISAPVEILRDEYGVPHISGEIEKDIFFGLGVAHAQDRLWQMEYTRRIAQGRLSEIMGSSTLPIDIFFRTIGFRHLIDSSYPYLTERTKRILEAYSKGVNRIVEDPDIGLPPEFALLFHQPEPWQPQDSLLILKMMSLTLSTNMFQEISRAQLLASSGPERAESFFPGVPDPGPAIPVSAVELYQRLPLLNTRTALPERSQTGSSNNWVVNGDHTASGKPLLANDPHLELTTPSIWYLAHLELPSGPVIGGTLAGVPIIILGRNENLAWGYTNTGADVQDLYIEKIDPKNPDKYLTPNGYKEFQKRDEYIQVRFGRDETIQVRQTRHGPVLPENWQSSNDFVNEGHVLALAWTALEEQDNTVDAITLMMEAKTVQTFREATRSFQHPMQNIVFADSQGQIGFIAQGRVPIRKKENELKGLLPAPGWDSLYDWDGFIPFDELPQAQDPQNGKLFTANNKIVPEGYAYDITHQWEPGYRASRIDELLSKTSRHDLTTFMAMQKDVLSPFARHMLPFLMDAQPESDLAKTALARLKTWDFHMRADQAEPLIFVYWIRALTQRIYQDDLKESFGDHWSFKPTFLTNVLSREDGLLDWCDNQRTENHIETCHELIQQSLEQVVKDLRQSYGDDIATWRWDVAHLSVHKHNLFGSFPILKDYFSLSIPSEGGYYTLNRGAHFIGNTAPFNNTYGSGYRAIYDFENLEHSVYLQSTGQSGHPESPFYSNFLTKWAETRYIPMTTRMNELRRNAVRILTIQPQKTQD